MKFCSNGPGHMAKIAATPNVIKTSEIFLNQNENDIRLVGCSLVDSLFIAVSLCFVTQYLESLISSFAIILIGKRELVALLLLSS